MPDMSKPYAFLEAEATQMEAKAKAARIEIVKLTLLQIPAKSRRGASGGPLKSRRRQTHSGWHNIADNRTASVATTEGE